MNRSLADASVYRNSDPRVQAAINMLYERASSSDAEAIDVSTGKIREWRSIITLIVFVLTSKLLLTGV